VAKNNQGEDEITIQGDVAFDIEEILQDKTPKIADVFGGGKIPEE
jgi:translation initiation factor 1 (eIF-1/SUI1)